MGVHIIPMSVLSALVNALFPAWCAVCAEHTAGGLICESCLGRRAEDIRAPAGLIGCRSLGVYSDGFGAAVRSAKYGRNLVLMDSLGVWLGRSIADWTGMSAEVVVSVPVPFGRKLMRGFDHGQRLAMGVSQATGIPHAAALKCTGPVRQVGNSASHRRQLPRTAFDSRLALDGKRVLLVDDVVTTGTTLSVAAEALRRGGAAMVWGLTVAHHECKENNTPK